ncbi:hypothetical protein D1007_07559 [Hordeum vulgare]|nr:hypothetical protein D1007_07559 [Hordeum vulgare]
MNRKDLTTMLEGLENVFQYASLQIELKFDKWKDVNITAWPREECIKRSLQTDGSSCGLWMINFMEYFTGNDLSDTPTQDHMTDFRTKLAVILVDSELNDDNIRNRDMEDDENNIDPTDCMLLDGPPQNLKTSNTSSDVELISQSYILSPSVNPTNDDLIDELCLFISMVVDDALLESEWVTISDPYPISLKLRQIKNILSNDEYMDIDCFNMVVRILARHEVQLLRDIPSHYMDLNFCDYFELRKRFLVHILKYEENESQNNIPYIEGSIIDRIYRWTFIASKDGPSGRA